MKDVSQAEREPEMTLALRVAQLERTCRRMRNMAIFGFVGCIAMLLMSAMRATPDTLSARSFVLLDANGKDCAVWTSEQADGQAFGSASLTFRSEHGTALKLSAGAGCPSLQLNRTEVAYSIIPAQFATLSIDPKAGPTLAFRADSNTGAADGTNLTSSTLLMNLPNRESNQCVRVERDGQATWSAP